MKTVKLHFHYTELGCYYAPRLHLPTLSFWKSYSSLVIFLSFVLSEKGSLEPTCHWFKGFSWSCAALCSLDKCAFHLNWKNGHYRGKSPLKQVWSVAPYWRECPAVIQVDSNDSLSVKALYGLNLTQADCHWTDPPCGNKVSLCVALFVEHFDNLSESRCVHILT